MRGISWPPEELLASQEGLCFMRFVNNNNNNNNNNNPLFVTAFESVRYFSRLALQFKTVLRTFSEVFRLGFESLHQIQQILPATLPRLVRKL
jgi:hypothetical protein